jgi:hypothetical protein
MPLLRVSSHHFVSLVDGWRRYVRTRAPPEPLEAARVRVEESISRATSS